MRSDREAISTHCLNTANRYVFNMSAFSHLFQDNPTFSHQCPHFKDSTEIVYIFHFHRENSGASFVPLSM